MKRKQLTAILLSMFFCIINLPVAAAGGASADDIIDSTARCLYETVPNPQFGSIGGEWCVFGLVRSSVDIPSEYFENYYQSIEQYVKKCGGVLHQKKYTEYSRLVLALTAIGKNPSDVSGYNLLLPLYDYESTVFQGVNGAVWALIALDSADYGDSVCALYIQHILDNQLSDGGWSLAGDTSEPDITAMALQALAKYRSRENVNTAVENALSYLSEAQNESGGFSDPENSESGAQVLVALCSLGISPSDERFVKNGYSITDNLLSYYENGKGFKHTADGATNQMATEQCFYALVALQRFNSGKNSLYDMSDAISVSTDANGLSGKIGDIKKTSVIYPGKGFSDTASHKNREAIEALASRNIINGKSDDIFDPDCTITRAEFSAILVRGLGLPEKNASKFSDVPADSWFCVPVNTAYSYGLINGISDTEFNPSAAITREEAAVMITRAAKLCGNYTDFEAHAVRDILAVFPDYINASDWATGSLAFCFNSGILSDEAEEIKPKEAVTRAEIAQMLYNMLSLSKLL